MSTSTVRPASFAQLDRLMRLLEDRLVPTGQKAFIRRYLSNNNKTMRGASVVIRKTIESKGEETYGQQLQEEKEMRAFLYEGDQLDMGFGD